MARTTSTRVPRPSARIFVDIALYPDTARKREERDELYAIVETAINTAERRAKAQTRASFRLAFVTTHSINPKTPLGNISIEISCAEVGFSKILHVPITEIRRESFQRSLTNVFIDIFKVLTDKNISNFDIDFLISFASSERHGLMEARDGRIDLAGTAASNADIAPRVEAARIAAEDLIEACDSGNIQYADLLRFAQRYREQLDELGSGKPSLPWYVVAVRIEAYRSNYAASSGRNPGEYPPMEPGLATLVDSLVIATAMLARQFPEIAKGQDQIQQYAGDQVDARKAVRELVDPALASLSKAEQVLTPRAAAVAAEVAELKADAMAADTAEAIRVTATKAGVLHGFLAVMAKLAVAATHQAAHLRENIRTKAGYDIGKEVVTWLIAGGYGKAVVFISASATALGSLAATWPGMFDFVLPLLRVLGLS